MGNLNNNSVVDDATWKSEFEKMLKLSIEKPILLVEFAKKGFPNGLRGWAWCRILRIEEVPRKE